MAFCQKCHKEHNLEEAPDIGICVYCKGRLIDNMDEKIEISNNVSDLIGDINLKSILSKRVHYKGKN